MSMHDQTMVNGIVITNMIHWTERVLLVVSNDE